jgi:MFS family permease
MESKLMAGAPIPETAATAGAAREVPAAIDQPSAGYARYVLTLLVIVYVLNFIDRQIISILAEDIKRDLGLTDADLGFLYGTAFGVFYALFGIPLGRLADNWNRVKLMSIGLAVWSAATAVSAFARTGGMLAGARIGVGVGEATASPCAYSLISDYFPKEKRATALAIYSSGLYIGGGLSLFIGGLIVQQWNAAYPGGGPLGLVGWQAAFLAVGIAGLLLASGRHTLREPLRGQADGLSPRRRARSAASSRTADRHSAADLIGPPAGWRAWRSTARRAIAVVHILVTNTGGLVEHDGPQSVGGRWYRRLRCFLLGDGVAAP